VDRHPTLPLALQRLRESICPVPEVHDDAGSPSPTDDSSSICPSADCARLSNDGSSGSDERRDATEKGACLTGFGRRWSAVMLMAALAAAAPPSPAKPRRVVGRTDCGVAAADCQPGGRHGPAAGDGPFWGAAMVLALLGRRQTAEYRAGDLCGQLLDLAELELELHQAPPRGGLPPLHGRIVLGMGRALFNVHPAPQET
jgi:hypothetical protein